MVADTEHVKPRGLYVEEAIAAALESRWTDAVAINEALIDKHGADEELYNRLGKARSELGSLHEALASYQSALELNALNLIAQKQVRRITALLEAEARPAAAAGVIDVDLFAEEPAQPRRKRKSKESAAEPPLKDMDFAGVRATAHPAIKEALGLQVAMAKAEPWDLIGEREKGLLLVAPFVWLVGR